MMAAFLIYNSNGLVNLPILSLAIAFGKVPFPFLCFNNFVFWVLFTSSFYSINLWVLGCWFPCICMIKPIGLGNSQLAVMSNQLFFQVNLDDADLY